MVERKVSVSSARTVCPAGTAVPLPCRYVGRLVWSATPNPTLAISPVKSSGRGLGVQWSASVGLAEPLAEKSSTV